MAPAPLKIALVITELEVGGAERCLAAVAERIDRRRFAPEVYSLAPRPAPGRDALALGLEREHVPVHFLGFSDKWKLPWAIRALAQALAHQQPQVMQSMLFHANVVAGLARRRLDGCAHCLGIRVADPSRVRQRVERPVALRANRVACVSQSVAKFVATRMGVPEDQLVVIPNGIDLQRFDGRQPADLRAFGLPPSRRALTCITRLAPQKGVDRLLRVAPRMLESLPGHDLLVVGDGPQAAALRQLAGSLGLSPRVHFAGWRGDVPEILLASDLLMLPSRWEGMPNVVLEAMACGRPVVCTKVEGIVELLGPLTDSQTVPADNMQAFADKAVMIIHDAALSRQLGERNRQRVTDHFSLDTTVQRFEELFEAVAYGP